VPTKYGIRNREFVIKIFKILKGSNFCNPLPTGTCTSNVKNKGEILDPLPHVEV
jgi:hypothetical protein